jgi:hypothetical protein
MNTLYRIGYSLSAWAACMSLVLSLCLLGAQESRGDDDPGPNSPNCQNKGIERYCDQMCAAAPQCGMGKCKSDPVFCPKCVCRIYKWGPPINMDNCECQE